MRKTLLGTGLTCAAPAATTYHGTWTWADDRSTTDPPLSGIWNVTLRPDGMANVHISLFKGWGPARSLGWQGLKVRPDPVVSRHIRPESRRSANGPDRR